MNVYIAYSRCTPHFCFETHRKQSWIVGLDWKANIQQHNLRCDVKGGTKVVTSQINKEESIRVFI